MAKHPFRKEHDKIMKEARSAIDVICAGADKSLEEMAIKLFGAVESHPDDGFGPPENAIPVECWHCSGKYSSSEMVRAYRPRCQAALVGMLGLDTQILTPLWWCKDTTCDGGGFGHDIHPARSKAKAA